MIFSIPCCFKALITLTGAIEVEQFSTHPAGFALFILITGVPFQLDGALMPSSITPANEINFIASAASLFLPTIYLCLSLSLLRNSLIFSKSAVWFSKTSLIALVKVIIFLPIAVMMVLIYIDCD